MKELSNTEPELKESVAYKKKRAFKLQIFVQIYIYI